MSETYTFRSIFSKPISYAKDEDPIVISKVIIPRIQRPYAQGRLGEAETKIRNSFLKDIFKYLTSENDAIMDFHFIYELLCPCTHSIPKSNKRISSFYHFNPHCSSLW